MKCFRPSSLDNILALLLFEKLSRGLVVCVKLLCSLLRSACSYWFSMFRIIYSSAFGIYFAQIRSSRFSLHEEFNCNFLSHPTTKEQLNIRYTPWKLFEMSLKFFSMPCGPLRSLIVCRSPFFSAAAWPNGSSETESGSAVAAAEAEKIPRQIHSRRCSNYIWLRSRFSFCYIFGK